MCRQHRTRSVRTTLNQCIHRLSFNADRVCSNSVVALESCGTSGGLVYEIHQDARRGQRLRLCRLLSGTRCRPNPAELARKIADRHYGVGGDGLIFICPSTVADARMRMFNADGSEAEMCGNGVRCVAKYVYDHDICRTPTLKIETGRGVLSLDVDAKERSRRARPRRYGRADSWRPRKFPPRSKGSESSIARWKIGRKVQLLPDALAVRRREAASHLRIDGQPACCLLRQGRFESAAGPRRDRSSNAPRSFRDGSTSISLQVHSPREVTMRTWERGSGITLACGTGAVRVCVAGVLTGRTERKILAHLPGGDLELEWNAENNHVYMTGPAVEVFTGEWKEP